MKSICLSEKLSFLHFAGFYTSQFTLLAYLAVVFLMLPVLGLTHSIHLWAALVFGSMIVAVIYLPMLVYFLCEGRSRGWLKAAALCGLVYGTTDFACSKGIWDAFWGRPRQWVPTNAVSSGAGSAVHLAEAVFGALLLVVPLVYWPELLFLPCSYLFAGKFLAAPVVAQLYTRLPG